jgi:hypothetical protein
MRTLLDTSQQNGLSEHRQIISGRVLKICSKRDALGRFSAEFLGRGLIVLQSSMLKRLNDEKLPRNLVL